jgi:soluble lytic murein transglycosylase-like protein
MTRGPFIGLLVAAAIVVTIAGAPAIGGEVETPELRSHVAKGIDELRDGHRRSVSRAMRAPSVLGVPRAHLEAIAECESHGDPRAVSGDGLYRGKYQFHRGTWASMGGSGDPARAPELEQDIRAAALIKASSSSPWPVCGS